MDRGFREERLAKLHPEVAADCALRSIARELTLDEIAILTRAAPARLLGLADRGQLGVGAAADIRSTASKPIARRCSDARCTCSRTAPGRARRPRDGHSRSEARISSAPGYDPAIEETLRRHWQGAWLDQLRSMWRSVSRRCVAAATEVRCLPRMPARARHDRPSDGEPEVRNRVLVDATYAEAFPMKASRILIQRTPRAGRAMPALAATGFRDLGDRLRLRAGIERELPATKPLTAGPV
jgi:hypothetical protein